MGIGVQSEACGEVTQHTTDSLDVHTVLQGDGSEGVVEVVKSDLRDACSFEDALQHIVNAVRGDGTAVGGREHILVIGFPLLCCVFHYTTRTKSAKNYTVKFWIHKNSAF